MLDITYTMQAAPGPADVLQQEGHDPHRAVKPHPGMLHFVSTGARDMELQQSRAVAPMQDTNQRVEKARQEMQELGITASGV